MAGREEKHKKRRERKDRKVIEQKAKNNKYKYEESDRKINGKKNTWWKQNEREQKVGFGI